MAQIVYTNFEVSESSVTHFVLTPNLGAGGGGGGGTKSI